MKYIPMESFQLDYISNKKGRIRVRPNFGDTLTLNDICNLKKKTEYKPKVEPKVLNIIQCMIKHGFTNTYIKLFNGLFIESNRILAPNQIKRLYSDAIEYNYYYLSDNKYRIETKNISF